MNKRLFKTKEAAAVLGVSAKTVTRLGDRGLLKYSKDLRHRMYTKESIEKFIQEANGNE